MGSKQPKFQYPKRFLWGASISAHQVEGGQHNQWSVWELENAQRLAEEAPDKFKHLASWPRVRGQAVDPANYVSGKAVGHKRLYAEDFKLLRRLNLNALRFSLEWSRIEPEEGEWDEAALEYYRDYLAELGRLGITPMLTLFHFTLPVWFAQKGGFEKRANVKYFVRFAKKAVESLGSNVRYIITINEPEVYASQSYYKGNWPPGERNVVKVWRVISNLAVAHNQAAHVIHGLNRRFKVSVAKNSVHAYAGDEAKLSRASARLVQFFADDYFMKKVIGSCDFIGLNYYMSARIYGYMVHNPDKAFSDMGWNLEPGDLYFVLRRFYADYHLPIIVTENGLADGTDEQRARWLKETLLAMQKAIDEGGVELHGYFHWSLLDNFEWDKGFWPRFGLVEVDRATLKRHIRPSALQFAQVIKAITKEE